MRIAVLVFYMASVFSISSRMAVAQLASDAKRADKLLDEALLTLDELSTAYCCRFEGTYAATEDFGPSLLKIYGLSVKAFPPSKAMFHSWGFRMELGQDSAPAVFVRWRDALRLSPDGPRQSLFKFGREASPKELPGMTEKQLGGRWSYPELDPFALVFGTESTLLSRELGLPSMMKLAAESELEKSIV